MRYATIVASLAFMALAAPFPVANNQAVAENSPIDQAIEARFYRTPDGKTTSDVEKRKNRTGVPRSEAEDGIEGKRSVYRPTKRRSLEEEDETEEEKRGVYRPYKRGTGRNGYRSVNEAEDDVEEKRQTRINDRSAEEVEAEVEKRGGTRLRETRGNRPTHP